MYNRRSTTKSLSSSALELGLKLWRAVMPDYTRLNLSPIPNIAGSEQTVSW